MRYGSPEAADELVYDARPEIADDQDGRPADAKPTEAVAAKTSQRTLKPWILPTGNDFLADPASRHVRPEGHPGAAFPFVQGSFDELSDSLSSGCPGWRGNFEPALSESQA